MHDAAMYVCHHCYIPYGSINVLKLTLMFAMSVSAAYVMISIMIFIIAAMINVLLLNSVIGKMLHACMMCIDNNVQAAFDS